MDTPSTNHAVRITDVLRAGQEIWVIARVREGGIGGMAITRVEDSVTVSVPDLPERIFLPGRGCAQGEEENLEDLTPEKYQETLVRAKRLGS